MTFCEKHQEILWLDLYGELNPMEQARWEHHLSICPSCRKEKARSARLLDGVKMASPAPAVPPDGAAHLIQRLRREKPAPKGRPMQDTVEKKHRTAAERLSSLRLSPSMVMAATLLLILSAGMLLSRLPHFAPVSGSGPPSETAAILNEEEAEVIRNLELLQEMEAVRKLVQRVDHPDSALMPIKRIPDNRRSEVNHEAFI